MNRLLSDIRKNNKKEPYRIKKEMLFSFEISVSFFVYIYLFFTYAWQECNIDNDIRIRLYIFRLYRLYLFDLFFSCWGINYILLLIIVPTRVIPSAPFSVFATDKLENILIWHYRQPNWNFSPSVWVSSNTCGEGAFFFCSCRWEMQEYFRIGWGFAASGIGDAHLYKMVG